MKFVYFCRYLILSSCLLRNLFIYRKTYISVKKKNSKKEKKNSEVSKCDYGYL